MSLACAGPSQTEGRGGPGDGGARARWNAVFAEVAQNQLHLAASEFLAHIVASLEPGEALDRDATQPALWARGESVPIVRVAAKKPGAAAAALRSARRR